MRESKLSARVIAFLLIAAIICIFADCSLYGSAEAFVETVGSQYSDIMTSAADYQSLQVLSRSNDNSQLLRLSSSEVREIAGRRSGSQNTFLKGQESSIAAHKLAIVHRYVHVTAFGNGRLSVIALSLGGNSPPVYHA